MHVRKRKRERERRGEREKERKRERERGGGERERKTERERERERECMYIRMNEKKISEINCMIESIIFNYKKKDNYSKYCCMLNYRIIVENDILMLMKYINCKKLRTKVKSIE